MINSVYSLLAWAFIAACIGTWYFFDIPFDIAFLIVGSAAVLLVYWLYIRVSPTTSPAGGNAKLADSKELEKSGVSRDR
jgi:membrane protein implicated in regulation of membrane protease activity